MAAAIPVFIPPRGPIHPPSTRPVTSANQIELLWDAAELGLTKDTLISVNVDAHVQDAPTSECIEISNLSQCKDHPLVPVTYYLKSDNAADDKPIEIRYLDDNKDYKQAIFILDGVTPIELPKMFRVLRVANASYDLVDQLLQAHGVSGYVLGPILGQVLVYEAGSSGLSTDTRTIVGFNGGFAGGLIETNTSFSSHMTVPKDYTGYVFGFDALVGKNDQVTFGLQSRLPRGEWTTQIPFTLFQGQRSKELRHRQAPELVDLRAVAVKDSVTADVPISLSYQILFFKNRQEA